MNFYEELDAAMAESEKALEQLERIVGIARRINRHTERIESKAAVVGLFRKAGADDVSRLERRSQIDHRMIRLLADELLQTKKAPSRMPLT